MSSYDLQFGLFVSGVAFSGKTYTEKALGGSESSALLLAEELVKLNQSVTVFSYGDEESYGDQMRTDYNGVRYLRLPEMWGSTVGTEDFDVFLVERDHNKLVDPLIRSRQLGLLNHDICTNGEALMANLYGTDFIYCLSQFHKQQYEHKAPELKGKIQVLGNPIDVERLLEVKDKVNGEKFSVPTFVYNSRPERGLLLLLKFIWPEVLQLYPDAELKVCFYSVNKERMNPNVVMIQDLCLQLMEDIPHVQYLGGLPKNHLYNLVARCQAVLYPSIFCESFNISCVESQILGTPYITTNMFAMKETNTTKSHLVFDYEQLNTAFYRTMSNGTVESPFLSNKAKVAIQRAVERNQTTQNAMTKAGEELIQRYDKKVIAQRFLDDCRDRFKTRWKSKGKRIIQNLIYHSDLVAAREAMSHYCTIGTGFSEEWDLVTDLLGRHHKDPEVYNEHVDWEYDRLFEVPERMEKALEYVKLFVGDNPFTLMDCGIGGGRFLYQVLKRFPNAQVQGLDFSVGLAARATKMLQEQFEGISDDCIIVGDFYDTPVNQQADITFIGEFMEHQQDVVAAFTKADAWTKPGGKIILTVPYGPLEAISHQPEDEAFHVQHYEKRDLEEILKDQMYTLELVQRQRSPKDGSPLAQWVITIGKQAEPKPYYYPNYQRKFETTRPFIKVGLAAICKNEEENVIGFLKPFVGKIDHAVILDTGSTDKTLQLLQEFESEHAEFNGFNGTWNDDFSDARNFSLHHLLNCDVDWVIWGDADERLTNPYRIKKYLKGDLEIYNGFRMVQYQMLADQSQNTRDFPIRLFRANKGYRFVGKIHENPQISLNEYIWPLYMIPGEELQFLHYGYTTEAIRREKAIHRNFALLDQDRVANPNRELGMVLKMRDIYHVTSWWLEKNDYPTPKQIEQLGVIVEWYPTFRDPKHLLHDLADLFYQNSLQILGERNIILPSTGQVPMQIAQRLVGAHGSIQDVGDPITRWFASTEELGRYLHDQEKLLVDELTKIPRYFEWN